MTSVEVILVPRALGLLLPEPAHQNARKTEIDDLHNHQSQRVSYT